MIELTIEAHSAPGGPVHETTLKRDGRLEALPCGCQSGIDTRLRLCSAVFDELTRMRGLLRAACIPTLSPTLAGELDIAAEIRALEQLARW